MRRMGTLFISLCIVSFPGTSSHGQPEQFAIYGRIVALRGDVGDTRAQSGLNATPQTDVRLITIKLHLPKDRGQPNLVAYPNAGGSFTFTNLTKDSYLLEASLGDQLLYQRVLKVESNTLLTIPVGDVRLIDKITVAQRTKSSLTGPEFQGRIVIRVGNIKRAMQPDQGSFHLSIDQGKQRIFNGTLSPPTLVAPFSYNNQKYFLVGAVRTASGEDFFDCEVYR